MTGKAHSLAHHQLNTIGIEVAALDLGKATWHQVEPLLAGFTDRYASGRLEDVVSRLFSALDGSACRVVVHKDTGATDRACQ